MTNPEQENPKSQRDQEQIREILRVNAGSIDNNEEDPKDRIKEVGVEMRFYLIGDPNPIVAEAYFDEKGQLSLASYEYGYVPIDIENIERIEQ